MRCQCGCGDEAVGWFLPGHDQKLRAKLEQQVGGLLCLKEIVGLVMALREGKVSDQQLIQALRQIY